MLDRNYFEVDGVGYTPSDFEYEVKAVEAVNESEAGTELVNIRRLDKHIFHASWEGIDVKLLDELISICQKSTVTVGFRNGTYICRARGITPKLAKKSYLYRHSDGLWNASVTFTQI